MDLFQKQKLQSASKSDLSRKGSVDKPIIELICFINQQEIYFTTSSCSGRICTIEENLKGNQSKKKGCVWLFMSHDLCKSSDIVDAVQKSRGNAVFKFEPFVLHVQCLDTPSAQRLQLAAINSGFRNSGISIGNTGKIIAAVRSTQSLEVPLAIDGRLLVSDEYIEVLVKLANEKLTENFNRINRFYENLKSLLKENLNHSENLNHHSENLNHSENIDHFLANRNNKKYSANKRNKNLKKLIKADDWKTSRGNKDRDNKGSKHEGIKIEDKLIENNNSEYINNNSVSINNNPVTINNNSESINNNSESINNNSLSINNNSEFINNNSVSINNNSESINNNYVSINNYSVSIKNESINNNLELVVDNNIECFAFDFDLFKET